MARGLADLGLFGFLHEPDKYSPESSYANQTCVFGFDLSGLRGAAHPRTGISQVVTFRANLRMQADYREGRAEKSRRALK